MLNLLIGILLGVFGMVIIALHLAAANKPKKPAPESQINCASLGDAAVEQIDAQLLNGVLRGIATNKLFEIPTTRH